MSVSDHLPRSFDHAKCTITLYMYIIIIILKHDIVGLLSQSSRMRQMQSSSEVLIGLWSMKM